MMLATQRLPASGIPVHSHTWEDEVTNVIKGRGFAVINEEQSAVPFETGSILYFPIGTWHGLRNVDPKAPMDVPLVTTPVKPNGLGGFFRFSRVEPGHPPLNLPEEEFSQVGQKIRHGSPAQEVNGRDTAVDEGLRYGTRYRTTLILADGFDPAGWR